VRLDVAALFSDPAALAMVPLYAVLMLATRGAPALLLYRSDLPIRRRLALALHSGTQLSLVVAITGIAVRGGMMPGSQGAALVGGGIVTLILFPALARPLLKDPTPR
jgi:Kef-type K+ transport system membrane component KefB